MATIRVTNQTELSAAVKAAKAGDTVVLAAGNYKELLVDDKISATAITFKSESSTNPAVIGYVRAIRSDGVAFQDLKVGRNLVEGVDQYYTNMALAQNSKNVSFQGVQFFSTGADASYLGRGLMIRDSENITVKASDFSHLSTGMLTMTSTGINVLDSKFHDLRIDGAEFTAVKNVVIDGNDFRDFRSSYTDHADAIQFWTNGTKQASTDVVISNNVVMPGTGKGSQGIFIQDEIGGIPYERITIKNNLLLDKGEYWNGITVRGGKDITIEGNTSISPTTDTNVFWIRLDNVVGAKLTANLADQLIQSGSSNLALSGNVFLNEQKTFTSKISGINLGTNATVSSLVVSGVGYQPSGGISSTSTQSTTTTKSLTTAPPAPGVTVTDTSIVPTTSTTSTASSTTTGTSSSTSASLVSLASLQPSTLASTLTPIASTTSATSAGTLTPAAAAAPVVSAPAVVAPQMTAAQQKAAAKAAAAAAKAQAKAAAAAAKAAAKAAKSNKSGTSIALTPVVSQPIVPVAAAPISSFTSSSFFIPNNGASFLTGTI